jgi:hypothetical protein
MNEANFGSSMKKNSEIIDSFVFSRKKLCNYLFYLKCLICAILIFTFNQAHASLQLEDNDSENSPHHQAVVENLEISRLSDESEQTQNLMEGSESHILFLESSEYINETTTYQAEIEVNSDNYNSMAEKNLSVNEENNAQPCEEIHCSQAIQIVSKQKSFTAEDETYCDLEALQPVPALYLEQPSGENLPTSPANCCEAACQNEFPILQEESFPIITDEVPIYQNNVPIDYSSCNLTSAPSCCIYGLCLQSYIDGVIAWRRDEVSSTFIQINVDPPIPSIVSTNIKNVDIFQLGAKGQLAWNCWFLRGAAYYGFIPTNHDSFKERHVFPSPPGQLRLGDIDGHTTDADVGLGYLIHFTSYPCLGWAPMAGWAYHKQHYIEENLNITELSGTKFITSWNGPWLGIDFLYQANRCLQFNGGYRLHFTKWKHEELFTPGFFQISDTSVVYGHTLYLEARWQFLCNFYFDLDLCYKYYSIGNKKPFVSTPSGLDHFESDYWWHSFVLGASLGYCF